MKHILAVLVLFAIGFSFDLKGFIIAGAIYLSILVLLSIIGLVAGVANGVMNGTEQLSKEDTEREDTETKEDRERI